MQRPMQEQRSKGPLKRERCTTWAVASNVTEKFDDTPKPCCLTHIHLISDFIQYEDTHTVRWGHMPLWQLLHCRYSGCINVCNNTRTLCYKYHRTELSVLETPNINPAHVKTPSDVRSYMN